MLIGWTERECVHSLHSIIQGRYTTTLEISSEERSPSTTTMPLSVTWWMLPVLFEIVAESRPGGDAHVLVEDGAADPGVPSDDAVVQDDRVLDARSAVHAHPSAQHGVPHGSAGEDAAARDDRIDRMSAAILVVEGELGRRIGVAGGAQRPLAVVEVEGGLTDRRSMFAS